MMSTVNPVQYFLMTMVMKDSTYILHALQYYTPVYNIGSNHGEVNFPKMKLQSS